MVRSYVACPSDYCVPAVNVHRGERYLCAWSGILSGTSGRVIAPRVVSLCRFVPMPSCRVKL